MNQDKLTENIIDQIKEAQIKLGYAKETVRLYYPTASLNALLGTAAESADELLRLLGQEAKVPGHEASGQSVRLEGTVLGPLEFSEHGGRIEVKIPPEGAEYVHREVPEPEFLKAVIELFATRHHCSLKEIRQIFEQFDKNYVCEKIPEEMGFDYALYFPDGKTDSYYYCVKEEMDHTIYHRFTKEDFLALKN